MVGLLRGFLGGLIAAATMAGGLRAIGRGEPLTADRLITPLYRLGKALVKATEVVPVLMGAKGGSKQACPPKGSMHHLAKCPVCGRRGHEHEPA
jgi:hypothetical protein